MAPVGATRLVLSAESTFRDRLQFAQTGMTVPLFCGADIPVCESGTAFACRGVSPGPSPDRRRGLDRRTPAALAGGAAVLEKWRCPTRMASLSR